MSPGAQVETADLRRRDVNVVGPGKVVVFGRAQEAEAVGQAFQHAFGEDESALFRLHLQDLENQLLFAEPGEALNIQILGDLVEVLNAHVLQLDQVQRVLALLLLGGAALLVEGPIRPEETESPGSSCAAGILGRRRRAQ